MIGSTLVFICTYILVASGYVVIYRASRQLNFAQGGFYMLGGYFAFTLAINAFQGLFPAAILILATLGGALISFVLGYLVFTVALRPVAGLSPAIPILLTVGLSFAIDGVVILAWGPDYVQALSAFKIPNRLALAIGDIRLSTFDLITVAVAIAWMLGLALFYKYSRVGMTMRAASEGPLLATLRGINIFGLMALAWGLGIFGAGLAGILHAANVNLSPAAGFMGMKAFPVAMLGGLNSLAGVIPAAIIVGLVESLVIRYGDPTLADVVPMLILLLVLIFRPWGILGRAEEIERV